MSDKVEAPAVEGDQEAKITIGGVELTPAQSATVRCAVAHWLSELESPSYRRRLGKIAQLYRKRLGEIQDLIFAHLK